MTSRKNKTKHYLAMWDNQGLECLYDVDLHMNRYNEWEKQKVIAILKEEQIPTLSSGIPLQMMLLRARVNMQRAYEIYEFNSTMAYDELKEVFNDDPQPIVEWIRENGKKVYSDYVKQNRKMIV
jgi:uncharacterized protein YrzB (UPF0473 family)